MKRNLSYIDSVHRDGRIWNISVMILLLMFPVSVCLIFDTAPDWGALAVGLLFAVGLFFLLPTLLCSLVARWIPSGIRG